MWTTLDLHWLSVTPDGLRRIAARHRRAGLGGLVRRIYRGNLRAAVGRVLGRLARAAYSTGSRRGPDGRRYRIFTARIGGQGYTLWTRPQGRYAAAILAVRPQRSDREGMVTRSGTIDIYWAAPTTVQEARQTRGGGVYIEHQGGQAVYVGEGHSLGDYIDQRGRKRRGRIATSVSSPDRNPGVEVRAGIVTPASEAARRLAEQITIVDANADHARRNVKPLANSRSTRPFRAGVGGVTVAHHGFPVADTAVVPPWLRDLPIHTETLARIQYLQPGTVYPQVPRAPAPSGPGLSAPNSTSPARQQPATGVQPRSRRAHQSRHQLWLPGVPQGAGSSRRQWEAEADLELLLKRASPDRRNRAEGL